MLRRLSVLVTFVVACSTSTPTDTATPPSATSATHAQRELLAEQAREREVHFARDPEAFARLLAEESVSIAHGEVHQATRAENQARFAEYFRQVEFLEWDDVVPPAITVAQSGELAVVRVQKRVTTRAAGTTELPRTTLFAWLAVLEKTNGEWLVTQVASTRTESAAHLWLRQAMSHLDPHGRRATLRQHELKAVVRLGSREHTLDITAALRSPDDTTSWRDANVHYVQHGPGTGTFEAWTDGSSGVARSSDAGADGTPSSLEPPQVAQIRNHAFVNMALYLDEWFTDWEGAGTVEFEKRRCNRIVGTDVDGSSVLAFIDQRTKEIVGIELRPQPETNPIVVVFEGWSTFDGLVVPGRLRIDAPDGVYRVEITQYRASESVTSEPAWVDGGTDSQ